MIGIDKELLIEYYSDIMNPVLYVCSESLDSSLAKFLNMPETHRDYSTKNIECFIRTYTQALDQSNTPKSEDLLSIIENTQKPLLDQLFGIKLLSGMIKPYSEIDDKGNEIRNFDEREWRIYNITETSDELILRRCSSVLTEEQKKECNAELKLSDNGYITLPTNILQRAITHIIVPKEKDITAMIDFLLKTKSIFGNDDIVYDDRLFLISKITSFERVEKDY